MYHPPASTPETTPGDTAIQARSNPEIIPEIPSSMLLDTAFIKDATKAIDLLYNRQYLLSLEVMEDWKKDFPNHPLWPLWPALEAWWPIIVDLEDHQHDKEFLRAAEKVISTCNDLLREDENNLDAQIIRSIANGQVARYYSNRFRWYRSFRSARRALRDFFQIESVYPDIPDIHFGIGMYRYFAAYLVEAYPIATPIGWMLPRGDREEGLERLKLAAENSIFMEPEAAYFLGHIYLHFEKEPDQALEYLKHIYDRYPNNSYFRRLYIRSLHQLQRDQEALFAIEESLSMWQDGGSHEVTVMKEDLYTIRGIIHLQRQNLKTAKENFEKAVNASEKLRPFATRKNLITSLFYLGEIHLENGNHQKARYYFARASNPDAEHPNAKRAREALESHF